MNFLLPVFQLLYFVAHFLVSLLQAVHDTYTDIRHTLVSIYHKIFCSSTALQVEEINRRGKLPQHAAIVFLPGKYVSCQLQQLVRVLVAFAGAGVNHLTAYDPAGKLEEQQEDLVQQVQEGLPGSRVVLLRTPCHDQRRMHAARMLEVRCREQPSVSASVDTEAMLPNIVYISVVSLDSGVSHLTACTQKLKSKQNKRGVSREVAGPRPCGGGWRLHEQRRLPALAAAVV
ncbi:hypothetical protein FHG87_004825 [Trinorchestia longiramus]|nr:hypothetical protein FHG87_004825 [Trinorchestia longiramus]